MDRQFGVVFDCAPEISDDLTQVNGIRTREAVMLNQLGIYFWGQIALWRHREISALAEDLQIPVARIVDEAWAEQAKSLCRLSAPRQTSTLPASALRTVSLLVGALLIGFLTVYLFGQHRNRPLTGILSADITTIRVPAASRLTSVQIKAGEEVFSGQPLLTLEKLEHLSFIQNQERLVRDLERELKRMEAQAAIELEWRTRDLDRELSNVRQRLTMRELNGTTADSVPVGKPNRGQSSLPVRSVSSSLEPQSPPAPRSIAGSIVFFSGATNQTSLDSGPIQSPVDQMPANKQPVRVAELPRNSVVSDTVMVTPSDPELDSLRSERSRLESVRESLPITVNEATGVTNLKSQFIEASKQLDAMKAASREVNVMSPVYGTVGQVRYREGDDMQAGEIMLRILHTDHRYVTAYLPTRRMNEMKRGQKVALRFPGNVEFDGEVIDIPMVADVTGESGETLAAVRIEQSGRLWPNIPVGSQIDVISTR